MLRLPAIATAVIVTTLLAWFTVSFVAAQRKLAPVSPPGDGRGNYQITLDFPPERFHQLRLQVAGRVVEVRGTSVYMMDVAGADLRQIAGEYWVSEVRAWDGR